MRDKTIERIRMNTEEKLKNTVIGKYTYRYSDDIMDISIAARLFHLPIDSIDGVIYRHKTADFGKRKAVYTDEKEHLFDGWQLVEIVRNPYADNLERFLIEVLAADRCKKSLYGVAMEEAERIAHKTVTGCGTGTVNIYDTIEEIGDSDFLTENNITAENIRNGSVENFSAVIYAGFEYFIEYVF